MTDTLARVFEERRQARARGQAPAARRVRAEQASPKDATLYLYDVIDSWGYPFGVSAKDVLAALDELDDDVAQVTLHVNSPGGELSEGIAIRNVLKQHKARVVTVVDGLAASSASFVALAGDEVVMAPNAEFMIHEPWGAVVGDAQDFHAAAAQLDKAGDNIARMYAAKAGGDVGQWRDAMHAETWLSDEEAVAAGLADRILEDAAPVDVKASFDLTIFNYAGRRNAPAPLIPAASAVGATEGPQGGGSMSFHDDLRQRLGIAESDADEATILAALDEALTEHAEPQTQDPPASLPEGTVVIDQAQLVELQAAAREGREARAQQQRERRESLVNAAVSDGRIAPARRDHWLAQLAADPGSEQVLASLAPGLVPLAETGHARPVDDDPAVSGDYWFAGAYVPAGTEG